MKELIAHKAMNGSLFIIVLLLFSVLLGPGKKTCAQGWSFTFQMAQTGPCGTVVPTLPALPNLALPTKGQCESLRETIKNIKATQPVLGEHGEIIGYCTVFFNCSECTGADITVPGQTDPGNVSFDGMFTGEPYFSPHQSSAFEDWAKDYRQLLESYGITSILGNQKSIFDFPITGNKEQDKYYKKEVDDFNPKLPDQDPNVVDLSGSKTGIVKLWTTPEEQKMRDAWYDENGFNNLSQASSDNALDEDGNLPAGRTIEDAALRTAIGQADGLAGVYGSFAINTVDGTCEGLQTVFDQAASGNLEQASETANGLPQTIVVNAASKTASDWVSDKVTDLTFGKLLDVLPGTRVVHKYVKMAWDFWENKQGK